MKNIDEQDQKNNFRLIAGIVIIFILIVGFHQIKNNKESKIKSNQSEENNFNELGKRNENSLNISLTVLNALGSYYLASTTYPDQTNDDIFYAVLFSFLEQNRYLREGNDFISSCLNDSSEIIKLVCNGMILGSEQIIEANEAMISFLKNIDLNDPKTAQQITVKITENLSSQKEGYKNIFISASTLGFLYFKGADSDKPTGSIPYLITKEERETLIKEIDNRFGEYIARDEIAYKESGNHNAILEAVKKIKSYVIYDTYEQSNKE